MVLHFGRAALVICQRTAQQNLHSNSASEAACRITLVIQGRSHSLRDYLRNSSSYAHTSQHAGARPGGVRPSRSPNHAQRNIQPDSFSRVGPDTAQYSLFGPCTAEDLDLVSPLANSA